MWRILIYIAVVAIAHGVMPARALSQGSFLDTLQPSPEDVEDVGRIIEETRREAEQKEEEERNRKNEALKKEKQKYTFGNVPETLFENKVNKFKFSIDPNFSKKEEELFLNMFHRVYRILPRFVFYRNARDLIDAEYIDPNEIVPDISTSEMFKKYFSAAFGPLGMVSILEYIHNNMRIILKKKKNKNVIATNVGMTLWQNKVSGFPNESTYKFGNTTYRIGSPTRGGVVSLNPLFFEITEENVFNAITTLVHEARHSQCTGGLPNILVKWFRSEIGGEDPPSRKCGHSHIKCPPGHDLAGIYACDYEPWGAYGLEAFLSYILLRSECDWEQCDDNQFAANVSDLMSRILKPDHSPYHYIKELRFLKLPMPDMSHTERIVP